MAELDNALETLVDDSLILENPVVDDMLDDKSNLPEEEVKNDSSPVFEGESNMLNDTNNNNEIETSSIEKEKSTDAVKEEVFNVPTDMEDMDSTPVDVDEDEDEKNVCATSTLEGEILEKVEPDIIETDDSSSAFVQSAVVVPVDTPVDFPESVPSIETLTSALEIVDSNVTEVMEKVVNEPVLQTDNVSPPPLPPSSGTIVNVTSTTQQPVYATQADITRDPDHGPVGCYLVYESSSSGRLMLYYSEGPVPENSVGFWCPGPNKKIQGFKFKQAVGRSELIKGIAGGDSNRRKYFIGWCQFCKLAKSYNGKVIQFVGSQQGVPVDIYAFTKSNNTPIHLDLNFLSDLSSYDAIAVMPKHHEFLRGVKSIPMTQFLELGNLAGATTLLS